MSGGSVGSVALQPARTAITERRRTNGNQRRRLFQVPTTLSKATQISTQVGIDNPRNCQSTSAHSPDPENIFVSAS